MSYFYVFGLGIIVGIVLGIGVYKLYKNETTCCIEKNEVNKKGVRGTVSDKEVKRYEIVRDVCNIILEDKLKGGHANADKIAYLVYFNLIEKGHLK